MDKKRKNSGQCCIETYRTETEDCFSIRYKIEILFQYPVHVSETVSVLELPI